MCEIPGEQWNTRCIINIPLLTRRNPPGKLTLDMCLFYMVASFS